MSKKPASDQPRFALVPHGGCTCPQCLMIASRGFVFKQAFDPHGGRGGKMTCKCEFMPGVPGKTKIEGYDPSKCYTKWQQALKGELATEEKAFVFKTVEEGDKYFRPLVDEKWASVTDAEKDAILFYTEDSGAINTPFYALEKMGDAAKKVTENLTNAINKYELPNEVVTYRGTNSQWLSAQLKGIDEDELDEWLDKQAEKYLNGKEEKALKKLNNEFAGCGLKCDAFTSTSTVSVYNDTQIGMRIHMPKGTKAMYVEPQSYYGATVGDVANPGYYTPGMQPHGLGECEVLLQRGSTLTVNFVEWDALHGRFLFDVTVTEQAELAGLEGLPRWVA